MLPKSSLSLVIVVLALLPAAPGCASAKSRRLDPKYKGESYLAKMKFRFEPGISAPDLPSMIEPGDLIAFTGNADGGGSGTMISAAMRSIRC